jgi:hypothetical protein
LIRKQANFAAIRVLYSRDPPALAVRLLDIRLAIRDEYIADLSHVRDENADIMKVSCMRNLVGLHALNAVGPIARKRLVSQPLSL